MIKKKERVKLNKKRGLTFSIIFRANSLNYGEGTANISELKKFHRGNGDIYTFASRQSLRYDIVRLGNQFIDWNLDVVDKAQGVVQFKADRSEERRVGKRCISRGSRCEKEGEN